MNTQQTPQDAPEASSSDPNPQDHASAGTGPQDGGPQDHFDPMNQKRILRRSHGPLSGVATGLSDYLGIDPVFGRLAFLVAGLTVGPGALLAYGAAWAVMSPPNGSDSPVDRVVRHDARIGGVSS